MTITKINFRRTFNYCILGTLIGAAVYCLFIIVPFFAFGLHLQPPNLVRGGLFDPKGYALYGSVLSMLTFTVMLIAPIWQLVFGSTLVITLKRHWRYLDDYQRRAGVLAAIISLTLIVFIFSPLGRLIMAWWAD